MAPVVSAALGVFGPLLVKLADLLKNECGRLKGVRREIRSLRSELSGMHGALTKYAKQADPDDQVKEWISLVRELAYDTEDCFDKFIHQLGDGRQDGSFREFFRKMARRLKTLGARRGIANQIGDLKVRIKEVKELKNSYKLDDTTCNTSGHVAADPRLAALFAEEAHLVGVDGPREDLAKWILEEGNSSTEHRRRVLSIVGFGGLGKTTLANVVYHKVQEEFNCHAFVSVSQKPDSKKIIKDVISQVSCGDELAKDIEMWDEKKSIAKLRELLHNKRYLIIIDDIWSILAWNAIKCAFPENNFSSRIIVTTRILEVARSCCPGGDDHIYEMPPLSDINSERLFFKRIFGSEECCPDMLRQVSSAILKKCGGLPLAIISISGLLANKPRSKEEWERVKRSIGLDLNKSQILEGMKNILSLSYNDLPPHLRTCLLYLSNFPEDYVIQRERLVRRWIAEGFISGNRGQSQQEVAESYFYELINKSLIQPVDIRYDGKILACRVHDMMLELIISKSIEDNFITVVSGRQTVWENSQCLIRRLTVQHIDQELASELAKKDLSHVRSLTVTSSSCIKHLPSLTEFKTLRVLDFESCQGVKEYDMSGMDKLFQLKYLSFRNTDLTKLPSGIVRLHGLETLDLRDTRIKELPTEIVQLTKLQQLLMESRYRNYELKIPSGIGKMTNLMEISGFNVSMSSVDAVQELGNLNNLGVLDVLKIQRFGESHDYKINEEMLLSSLSEIGNFGLLGLSFCSARSSPLVKSLDTWSPSSALHRLFDIVSLPKLPKWIAPDLTSLAYLDIGLREVTEEDLDTLGELPALLSLKLFINTVQEKGLPVKARGFRSLKQFVYARVGGGTASLVIEEGAFPMLEMLGLWFFVSAAKACGFCLGIENLPCLKDLEVTLSKEGATSSEVEAAAVAIKKEANLYPSHPRLTIHGEVEEISGTVEEVSNEHKEADEAIHFIVVRSRMVQRMP